jgi:hypothetical protein
MCRIIQANVLRLCGGGAGLSGDPLFICLCLVYSWGTLMREVLGVFGVRRGGRRYGLGGLRLRSGWVAPGSVRRWLLRGEG